MKNSSHQILVFELSNCFFGLPAGHVVKILPMPSLTPVPRAPKYLMGLTNYRNHIVPVYSLALLLKMDAEETTPYCILSSGSHGLVGYAVSSVHDIRDAEEAKVLPEAVQNYTADLRLQSVIQFDSKEPKISILAD